jgi:hypothetical protein
MQRLFIWVAMVGVIVGAIGMAGCSDTVRLPDCIDCRPVEMSLDDTLEVELGSDRAVTNDPDAHEWVVTDSGTITLVSEERGTRPEDESEFTGGYSRYVIYRFEPSAPGTTQLQFAFQPTETTDSPANTLDITVIVDE